MTKNSTTNQAINATPATACTLSGAYLIEASAGTGKTWTLSGIILRLLVEKKYAPERIIATTFTRAAAAEMQERILARLTTFYRYLTWLKSKQEFYPSWFDRQTPISERLDGIVQNAKQAGVSDADDIINVHLLGFLLGNDDDFAFDEAFRRVGLLLSTLDKLFVGTLDSLAQKWLKEFAAEIGHQTKAEILYDSDDITTAIIHDSLRKQHAQLVSSPLMYQLLGADKFFGDVDGAKQTINLAVQFFDAPIDSMPSIDEAYLAQIGDDMDEILSYDLDEVREFLDADYRKAMGIHAQRNVPKNLQNLPKIQELIKKHGLGFVHHLSEFKKWLDAIADVEEPSDLLTKKHQPEALMLVDFVQQKLMKIPILVEKIKQAHGQCQAFLYRQIAEEVRKQSPNWLESMGKTTFTLQMKRLNDALQNNPDLVRRIRHHYPVALIDESQDVNGAQTTLIEQVYLKPLQDELKKDKTPKGFVLLVGDPKQAIYRFRGGDVSNYNYMKFWQNAQNAQNAQKQTKAEQSNQKPAQIINKNLTLTVNRRSNKALIDALNQWFVNEMVDDFNPAKLGDGIYYQHIEAHNQNQRLSWQNEAIDASYLGNKPLAVLHFPYLSENGRWQKHQAVAHHINSLLQNPKCTMNDDAKRAIVPSDIAVLARSKAEFSAVKKYLDKLNIPAIAIKDENVFAMPAAQDLYALLSACVDAANLEKLGRLLSGKLFDLSLDEIGVLLGGDEMNDGSPAMGEQHLGDGFGDGFAERKTKLLGYLAKIHERWQKYGIASAIWYALSINPLQSVRSDGLWLNAAKAGERYLADLWQVVELVGEQSHLHELALLEWYEVQAVQSANDTNKRKVLPSEAGVNLMTIHASKGLEFPIVYVLGLETPARQNQALFYPYSDDNYKRRLSPVACDDQKDYQEDDLIESVDEAKRLGYVALTRASEQVYVVAQDAKDTRDKLCSPWFVWCQCTKQKELALPQRMYGKMDWIELLDCEDLLKNTYDVRNKTKSPIHYADWQSVLPTQVFDGIYQASFTRLINQLDVSVNVSDDDNQDTHDELPSDKTIGGRATEGRATVDLMSRIQGTFVRGAVAGEFLHKVLQEVDTTMPITDKKAQLVAISQEIDRQARKLGLSDYLSQKHQAQSLPSDANKNTPHRQLVLWLYDVIFAKFGASGTNLKSLHTGNSVREMKFVLGLKQGFGVAQINKVFAKYANECRLQLTPDHAERVYHYLKGEIDLLYEHDGKFFVLDYKSNFLGDDWQDYQTDSLKMAMDKAGYWLQAAFYQVALHRLLKMRVADYAGNESRYLGATEYLFLRGIANDKADDLGRMIWQIPLELVLALDELFD